MTSSKAAANLRPAAPDDKNTVAGETLTVSVRMPKKLARLVRQAAAARNTTRSAFMAEVAIREARVEMKLQRDEDLAAYLEQAA